MSLDRLGQITNCVEEIHRCEAEIASGKYSYEQLTCGAWLGYLDWLDALHQLIHAEDDIAEI